MAIHKKDLIVGEYLLWKGNRNTDQPDLLDIIIAVHDDHVTCQSAYTILNGKKTKVTSKVELMTLDWYFEKDVLLVEDYSLAYEYMYRLEVEAQVKEAFNGD